MPAIRPYFHVGTGHIDQDTLDVFRKLGAVKVGCMLNSTGRREFASSEPSIEPFRDLIYFFDAQEFYIFL